VSVNIDAITGWTCTVDDKPCVWSVPVVRAQSDAKRFNVRPNSILTESGYAPGVRDISVADGYWVMLDPLPRGKHTIHFTSSFPLPPPSAPFSLDVTYHLKVK
jgi:hypothetical protein